MTTIPDCPRCSARDTLEPIRVEAGGVLVCTCSCCTQTVRVGPKGNIVHDPEPDQRDVSGTVLSGDG